MHIIYIYTYIYILETVSRPEPSNLNTISDLMFRKYVIQSGGARRTGLKKADS